LVSVPLAKRLGMFSSNEVWERGGILDQKVVFICSGILLAARQLRGKIILCLECLKPPRSRAKYLAEEQPTECPVVLCCVRKSAKNF